MHYKDYTKYLLIVFILLAGMVVADIIVTMEDGEQTTIDPEDIPISTPITDIVVPTVDVPVVEVPIVEVPETSEVTLAAGVVSSVPSTFYALPTTVPMQDYTTVVTEVVPQGVIKIIDVVTGTVNYIDVQGAAAAGVDVNYINVEGATVASVTVEGIAVNTGAVSSVEVQVTNISVPTVFDYAGRFMSYMAFRNELKSLFTDKRAIEYDTTINSDNVAAVKWLNIYRTNTPYIMTYVRPRRNIKMIAEARVPKDQEERATLIDNLDFYKKQGYNAVLMPFYLDETLYGLKDTAQLITSKGFALYIVYSGPETLESTVLKDPDMIKNALDILAPMASGMLLGWRKTSVHLFIPDQQFTNYICRTARSANPDIAIIGEGYYGETAASKGNRQTLTYNMPVNSSACCINGVGYNNININGVVKELFKDVARMDKLAVILGDRPYYNSSDKNGLSFSENLAIKQELEKKFRQVGCSTITLHGDGSNEPLTSDNMSTTKRN